MTKENESLVLTATSSRRYKIDSSEWLEISRSLEDHHAVFYKIWQMGRPVFDETIPTACVNFDKEGKFVWFRFNPNFWDSLDLYNKLFVICHEALHVVLNHGSRSRDSGINSSAANIAMDVVVNHSLVRNFLFDRDKVKNSLDYCWVDTVFKDRDPLPDENETFEHYMNLFDVVYGDGMPGDGEGSGFKTVDDHSKMGGWEKVIKDLNDSLTEEEKESLQSTIQKHFQEEAKQNPKEAGTAKGGWVFAKTGHVKKKRKWETIIRRWALKHMKTTDKEVDQWARINRRMTMLPRDMMLPSEATVEVPDNESSRIEVWFFLDTSGSCWDLKDRFFAAAESLPEKRFDVRLFCFDTSVEETTLKSRKIYGGGGTSFDILEKHVVNLMAKESKAHPEAVFVITDGYGNRIRPSQPKRWHWFLTADGSRSMIPQDCNIYSLGDFE